MEKVSSKKADAKPKSKSKEEKPASKPKSATKPKPASKAEPKSEPASRGQMKLGSVLPKITVLNDVGEEVDVASLAAEKGVVVFLYPRVSGPDIAADARRIRQDAPTRRVDSVICMARSLSLVMRSTG